MNSEFSLNTINIVHYIVNRIHYKVNSDFVLTKNKCCDITDQDRRETAF